VRPSTFRPARRRSRAAVCLLLACALLAARPAAAQAPANEAARRAAAKKLAQKATRKYNVGQFREALDGYTRAYDTFPAPGLLFNIGQCHRGLRQHEHAVRAYEAYLREQPDAPNRTLVEELIGEEENLLRIERQAEAARAAEVERQRLEEADYQRAAREQEERERRERERRERREQTAADPTPPLVVEPPPARDEPERSVFKAWWFWTAVGAVALAAGGGALYLNAQRDSSLPEGTLGTHDQR
jgi:tetratricopeptide (TPR) repeat protein